MKIRPIQESDQDDWLQMRMALYGDKESLLAAEIQRFFSGQAGEPLTVLVAEQDGRLVGMAELSIHLYAEGCQSDHVGYLEGWYVDSSSRNQGIGRELLKASEAWARSQGCTELATDTHLENVEVSQIYKTCGYEEVAQLRCFRKSIAADSNS